MPTKVTGIQNLHTLAGTAPHPLGVACEKCDHRRLIDQRRLDAHSGNMRELSTLKFVCTACDGRQFSMWLFHSAEDAEAFLHPPPALDPSF
jgi:hypothetical protein